MDEDLLDMVLSAFLLSESVLGAIGKNLIG